MAKVKGALLSMSAQGQVGKSMVFANWRGVPYARQHVTPRNPRTTAQQTTRDTFDSLDNQWKRMFSLSQAPWKELSRGRAFVGRNALMSSNIPVLRGESDMTNWIGSPGTGGGLPPESVTANDGASSGDLEVDIDVPQAPTDWTLQSVVAQYFPDRDPATRMTTFVQEEEDDTASPNASTTITFSGVTTGQLMIVAAWPIWERADGTIAYGPSQTDSVTVT